VARVSAFRSYRSNTQPAFADNQTVPNNGGVILRNVYRNFSLKLAIATSVITSNLGCQSDVEVATSLKSAGVRVASDFGATGVAEVAAIPLTAVGDLAEADDLALWSVQARIGATLQSPTASITSVTRVDPSLRSSAWAVLIDSSGSNGLCPDHPEECGSDLKRTRVAAASDFVRKILNADPTAQVAVFDFGFGQSSGTFFPLGYCRMLTDFGSDIGALETAIGQVSNDGEEGTPLYGCISDVMDYLTWQQPETTDRRMLVFSDGQPTSDYGTLYGVTARCASADVPVCTVGYGFAAADSELTEPAAVDAMRDIAQQCSCFYLTVGDVTTFSELLEGQALAFTKGYYAIDIEVGSQGSRPVAGDTVTLTVGLNTGGDPLTVDAVFVAP
jgi:hypothetical protein